MIRFLLVFYFIITAFYHRVFPWRFFYLNSRFFNREKGLFSKLDIDQLIPARFRLQQQLDNSQFFPEHYPVFVKPEWGQNGCNISRADSEKELQEIRKKNQKIPSRFIIQEVAPGRKELEIFYTRSVADFNQYSILSITEVFSDNENYPIHSVHNPHSQYKDYTSQFSHEELEQLWRIVSSIGKFRLARVGLRTNSKQALLAGEFKIIEINLFLPMPLSLLDPHTPWEEKHRFIRSSMKATALLVGTIPKQEQHGSIFFRKMYTHYRMRS